MVDAWLIDYWTTRANLSAMTDAQLWQFTLMLDTFGVTDRMTEAVLLMDNVPQAGTDYSGLDAAIISRVEARRERMVMQ